MIVPMKRLTLVALKEDEGAIMKALQSIGAVQVIQTGEAATEDDDLSQAEGRVQRLNNALSLLKPYAKKPGMLTPKPETTAEALDGDLDTALALSKELEAADSERTSVRSQIEKYNGLILALTPWQQLSTPMNAIRATRNTVLFAGTIGAEQKKSLEELPDTAAVQVFEDQPGMAAVLILAAKEDEEQVNGIIRQLEWNDMAFPQLDKTPAEAIEAYRLTIKELEEKAQQIEERLQKFGEQNQVLSGGADAARIHRDRVAARTALVKTTATFFLEGWVREDQMELVETAVSSVTDAYCTEYREPAEDETEPVVLKNSKLVEPYEAVTNLYSLPAAGSIDGTPLMAPFYFIFFGMMLSDTAYGIVLALGALAFLKLAKPSGMMGSLARVLFQGGISTIFMGLLFGTFAGVTWPVILKGTGLETVFPLIDSSNEPIAMLAVCAGLGLVHMFYAVLIATKRCIDQKDYVGAFVDNFCWILIIVGLLMLAAPMLGVAPIVAEIGKWMAIGAAAVVLLFTGRGKKNPFSRLASGAGKLYDITAWLGDVLSYARIFALGLSTGVIGLVLNTLCWDMLFASFKGNVVLMIIGFVIVTALSVGLHLFMMAISTLGCFVHTARLQYVEFFGKFYENGGKAFAPLSYKTKHVRITEK